MESFVRMAESAGSNPLSPKLSPPEGIAAKAGHLDHIWLMKNTIT